MRAPLSKDKKTTLFCVSSDLKVMVFFVHLIARFHVLFLQTRTRTEAFFPIVYTKICNKSEIILLHKSVEQ